MEQFLDTCFSWPVWPASVLLVSILVYWVLMMVGAVDLDFLDIEIDADFDIAGDADVDVSILQIGFVPVKWLNIGSVPTMLWVSIFSLTGWLISVLWNGSNTHDVFQLKTDVFAIVRDFGIAALLTKLITQPLRGRFDPVEPNKADDLIGRVCVVTTSEVTETFGEAELPTDAAPLKLKVRSRDTTIQKGDTVVLVDFHSEGTLFDVARIDSEVV